MSASHVRQRAVALAILAAAAAAPAAAEWPSVGPNYKCTPHIQIGGDKKGPALIKSFQIDKEITYGSMDCAKACSDTPGCIAINVKEIWVPDRTGHPHEVTICQLFDKVGATTPFPVVQNGTWGFACVVTTRTLGPPGRFTEIPGGPPVPNSRDFQDSRPGTPGSPGTPGRHRP